MSNVKTGSFSFENGLAWTGPDDSRIRSKPASFSFENGLVWTGPKERILPRRSHYLSGCSDKCLFQ